MKAPAPSTMASAAIIQCLAVQLCMIIDDSQPRSSDTAEFIIANFQIFKPIPKGRTYSGEMAYPAQASAPPVIGSATPVVVGKVSGRPLSRADAEKGEGLRLDRLRVPAKILRPAHRTRGSRRQRLHQGRIVRAAAADHDQPRLGRQKPR